MKYADDLVILRATREQAEQAREQAVAILVGIGLRLHPDKTRIADLSRGAEGFEFLGFEHRMCESWKQPGRWYLQKWSSRRAMGSVRAKIRARTDRRYARLPLEWAVPPRRNGQTHACVCRPVNDVGEPCAGEPHARFDAAAGDNPGPVGYAARSPDASRRPYLWAASRRLPLSSSAL